MININIDDIEINNISTLISKFSTLHDLEKRVLVNLFVNIPTIVYPECLTIVVSLVKFFEYKGIKFNINVNNPNNNNYVSRINFYRALGIPFEEKFKRWNSDGRFVEITNFNGDNNIPLVNNILRVIRDNCNIDTSVTNCLNYCFFEMVDNIENHAVSPIGGYTVAQNYSYANELRIVIIDAGIGIHNSLTKTEGTKYEHLSPEESLQFCIRKEVTNGKGMGNGLYHTTEFIKRNNGEMQIYSGENCLYISGSETWIENSSYLQGTLIYVKIKTNRFVDFKDIFGEEIPETVINADDYIDDTLW